jgi:DNA-binding CsgD family transcriptional regulator
MFPAAAFSQNTIGLPNVVNYLKTDYNGGLQNWDIKQDNNKIIYIANNEGLLSFDGTYWNLYPLANKTIVRAICIGDKGKIYTGGQDEIGYFQPDHSGKLIYHSLISYLSKADKSFGDVWDIEYYKNEIFFRSASKIFRCNGNNISVFNAPLEWSFLGSCNGKLYAHDYKSGLLEYQNNNWLPVAGNNKLPGTSPVTGIISINKDSGIIATLKGGLFLINSGGISPMLSAGLSKIQGERIYTITSLKNHLFAAGTSDGGLYILNNKGEIVQRFTKIDGLQDSNVLSVFADSSNNIWTGLNTGICYIAYNSAIKSISIPQKDGSGYTSVIHQNYLYAGTSAGLFSVKLTGEKDISLTKGYFEPVENAQGQTWGLAEINGKLLLGHHEGQFLVTGNTAQKLNSYAAGFWNFSPLTAVYPAVTVVAGNYRGLTFLNYADNTFKTEGNVSDFNESSRFVVIDNAENIWVSHPYHGVFRSLKNSTGNYVTKTYGEKNGLPSTLNNYVFKIRNEFVAATEKGIYSYNQTKDIFEPAEFYRNILGTQSLRYLKEDTEGNIWFIHEKQISVLDFSQKEPQIISIGELQNKLTSGFESVYAYNERNIFVTGEKGFFHVDYQKYRSNIFVPSVKIQNIKVIDKKDSLLFGGYFNDVNEKQLQDKKLIPELEFLKQTIQFQFSSPAYEEQGNTEYSYRLKGFDPGWSEWSKKTEKEYTNLTAGNYNFEVKSRINFGQDSSPASFAFKILPPWYQTVTAYIFYFILFCFLIYLFQRLQNKKFNEQQIKYEAEQKKLQYLHQLEMDKTASQLVALRNEKLQAEIDFKNSELATSAMHLVQKGELLTKIKGEINSVMKSAESDKILSDMKKVMKSLSEDDKTDKDWGNFAKHFDKVHSDFVMSLKQKYPAVSGNELKLSAYLRMNLSTKEIAQLMNISVRGVEISRYRLRKKLGIPTEVSLFDFLMTFSK